MRVAFILPVVGGIQCPLLPTSGRRTLSDEACVMQGGLRDVNSARQRKQDVPDWYRTKSITCRIDYVVGPSSLASICRLLFISHPPMDDGDVVARCATIPCSFPLCLYFLYHPSLCFVERSSELCMPCACFFSEPPFGTLLIRSVASCCVVRVRFRPFFNRGGGGVYAGFVESSQPYSK